MVGYRIVSTGSLYLVDDEAREAEVGEFSLSVIVEKNVLTFEITMRDVVTV